MAKLTVVLAAVLLLSPQAAARCNTGEQACSDTDHAILLQSGLSSGGSISQVSALAKEITIVGGRRKQQNQDASHSDNDSSNGSNETGTGNNTNSTNEVELPANSSTHVNKVLFALIELTILPACCGIDRCYTGQYLLGVIKGLTLGGATIWAFIDYFGFAINALERKESIDILGYNATFTQDTVEPSFWITAVIGGLTVFWASVICVCGAFGGLRERLAAKN
jgi:hypothetical protein